MAKKKLFEETKVKMVMKLKKLTYRAAVEEIARIDAARMECAREGQEYPEGEPIPIGEVHFCAIQ